MNLWNDILNFLQIFVEKVIVQLQIGRRRNNKRQRERCIVCKYACSFVYARITADGSLCPETLVTDLLGKKNAFQFGSETFRNEDQIIQNTAHIYRTSKPQFLSQYITAVYSSCSSRTAPRQAPARDEQLFMGLTRGVNTARRETAPPAARDVKQRVDKFKAGGSPS